MKSMRTYPIGSGGPKLQAWRAVSIIAAGLALAESGLGQNNAGGDVPVGPTALAADVRHPGQLDQVIRVFFDWRRSVDTETLGDGDITVTGPLGYAQRGRFVSFEQIDGPMPLPLDRDGNGETPDAANGFLPQPVPMVVATYRVFPSEFHDGPWSPAQNGPYAIQLNADEVRTVAGESYPPGLLGGFRVALGDGEPQAVLPDDVRITIGHDPVVSPVDGGANGLPGTATHFHALVELFFASRDVEVTDWGQVTREGNRFTVSVRAVRVPGDSPDGGANAAGLLAPPSVFAHRYGLGALAPGDYRFIVRALGQQIGAKEFHVDDGAPVDDDPPMAVLHAAPVTEAGDRWHGLTVVFDDPSGADIGTLGSDDLRVLQATRCDLNAAGLCADSGLLPVVFVEARPSANDLRRVEAHYRVGPPDGGWSTAANGFYTVLIEDGQVCDLLGNCNHLRPIGGFQVVIDDDNGTPVPAKAEIRVDASDATHVIARVAVEIASGYAIVNQGIRRDGSRIILSASALPTPGVPPANADEGAVTRQEILERFTSKRRPNRSPSSPSSRRHRRNRPT